MRNLDVQLSMALVKAQAHSWRFLVVTSFVLPEIQFEPLRLPMASDAGGYLTRDPISTRQ